MAAHAKRHMKKRNYQKDMKMLMDIERKIDREISKETDNETGDRRKAENRIRMYCEKRKRSKNDELCVSVWMMYVMCM